MPKKRKRSGVVRMKNSQQKLNLEGAFTRMEVGKLRKVNIRPTNVDEKLQLDGDKPLALTDAQAARSLGTLSKRSLRTIRRRKKGMF